MVLPSVIVIPAAATPGGFETRPYTGYAAWQYTVRSD